MTIPDAYLEHKCNCELCWTHNHPQERTLDETRRYRNFLLNTARLYSDYLKRFATGQ